MGNSQPPSAVPQIFCPNCNGGNPLQATNCMWCGRPLVTNTTPPPYQAPPQPAPYPYMYAPAPSAPPRRWSIAGVVAMVMALAPYAPPRRWNKAGVIGMVIALALSMVVGFGLAYIADHTSLSANTPPTYVKQVAAYKDGERTFTIYFSLADETSNETTGDGIANVSISEHGQLLYTKTVSVAREDFERMTEDIGAIARDAIVYSFGRMSYDTFDRQPTGVSGEVRVTFTTSEDKIFDGEDSVIFDK